MRKIRTAFLWLKRRMRTYNADYVAEKILYLLIKLINVCIMKAECNNAIKGTDQPPKIVIIFHLCVLQNEIKMRS